MNIDEQIEVMQAYRDGKTIQVVTSVENFKDGKVQEFNKEADRGATRTFNFTYSKYRVKPEQREFWLVMSLSPGLPKPMARMTESGAKTTKNLRLAEGDACEIVHVREVIDE